MYISYIAIHIYIYIYGNIYIYIYIYLFVCLTPPGRPGERRRCGRLCGRGQRPRLLDFIRYMIHCFLFANVILQNMVYVYISLYLSPCIYIYIYIMLYIHVRVASNSLGGATVGAIWAALGEASRQDVRSALLAASLQDRVSTEGIFGRGDLSVCPLWGFTWAHE